MVQVLGERELRGIIWSEAFLLGSVWYSVFSKAFGNSVNGDREIQAQEFHKVIEPGRATESNQSETVG